MSAHSAPDRLYGEIGMENKGICTEATILLCLFIWHLIESNQSQFSWPTSTRKTHEFAAYPVFRRYRSCAVGLVCLGPDASAPCTSRCPARSRCGGRHGYGNGRRRRGSGGCCCSQRGVGQFDHRYHRYHRHDRHQLILFLPANGAFGRHCFWYQQFLCSLFVFCGCRCWPPWRCRGARPAWGRWGASSRR